MPEISTQQVEQLASLLASLQAIVGALQAEKVQVSPEIRAMVARKLKARICLQRGEVNPDRYTRGCCANCYNDTMKRIKEGEVTEAELIQKGLLTEVPQKGGRKSGKPTLQELIEAIPDAEPSALAAEAAEKSRKYRGKK